MTIKVLTRVRGRENLYAVTTPAGTTLEVARGDVARWARHTVDSYHWQSVLAHIDAMEGR